MYKKKKREKKPKGQDCLSFWGLPRRLDLSPQETLLERICSPSDSLPFSPVYSKRRVSFSRVKRASLSAVTRASAPAHEPARMEGGAHEIVRRPSARMHEACTTNACLSFLFAQRWGRCHSLARIPKASFAS